VGQNTIELKSDNGDCDACGNGCEGVYADITINNGGSYKKLLTTKANRTGGCAIAYEYIDPNSSACEETCFYDIFGSGTTCSTPPGCIAGRTGFVDTTCCGNCCYTLFSTTIQVVEN